MFIFRKEPSSFVLGALIVIKNDAITFLVQCFAFESRIFGPTNRKIFNPVEIFELNRKFGLPVETFYHQYANYKTNRKKNYCSYKS